MNDEMKSLFAKVEKMLAQVVGQQKIQLVPVNDFPAYAMAEIEKAQAEPLDKARIRLSLLSKSFLYTSAIIEDQDSEGLKVPVFVIDQTTFAEQSNELYTPQESEKMNPENGTVFENAVAKKVAELQGLVDGILKSARDVADDLAKTPVQPAEGEDVVWPDDLNDKNFVSKGKVAEPTWGNDR